MITNPEAEVWLVAVNTGRPWETASVDPQLESHYQMKG